MINDSYELSKLFILGKVKAVGKLDNIIPLYGHKTMTMYIALTDLEKKTFYRITKQLFNEFSRTEGVITYYG